MVAHDNGRLSIHSLPDMELVYQIGRFSNVPELLMDMTTDEEEKERKAKAPQAAKETAADEDQLTTEMKKLCERVMEAQIVGKKIDWKCLENHIFLY